MPGDLVMGDVMRTGVIQPLPGIGDMIWLLPALKAISQSAPDGKLTLFTRASTQAVSLFHNEPWIERVVYLPPNKRGVFGFVSNMLAIRKALRQALPDRLYVLHHSPRYGQAAKFAGVRKVLAYSPAVKAILDTGWTRSLAFLKEIGIPVPDTDSRLTVSEAKRLAVAEEFSGLPRPWLVVAPGASEPVRCWPAENFAQVAKGVITEAGGTLFLVGAKGEAGIIERLHALCGHAEAIKPLAGRPLDEVMALMSLSDVLLGNDSGPVNLAAALGCDAYALCGVTRPAQHSPKLHLIEPEGEASMEAITPTQVLDAVLDQLR